MTNKKEMTITEFARLGGLARWKNSTKEERIAHAKKMGRLGGKPRKIKVINNEGEVKIPINNEKQ